MTASFFSLTPGATIGIGVARVEIAAPIGRLSLRARGDLAPLNAALGLTLPERIGARANSDAVEALQLGPDEWVLHAPLDAVASIETACAAIYGDRPHSLVDVSGREVCVAVSGPAAIELLTLGCPRDLDAIPTGEGRRTLFDGASVVLWRDAPDRFRLEIWRSFAPHLLQLIETGLRELAAELT